MKRIALARDTLRQQIVGDLYQSLNLGVNLLSGVNEIILIVIEAGEEGYRYKKKKSKSDPEKFKLILVSEWIIKLYSATDVQQSELNSEKQTFLLPGMIGHVKNNIVVLVKNV